MITKGELTIRPDKIIIPFNLQNGFGKKYVSLRYLGLLQNGDLEEYCAELRACLISGTKNEQILKKLDALFYNGELLGKSAMLEEDKAWYAELRSAIINGISDEDKLRAEILFFVSKVTKNYTVLEGVLRKVQFANFSSPKEFSTIYEHFARQSTSSGEKKEQLANIRDRAFRILINQTQIALRELKDAGKESEMEDLYRMYQDNLFFVTYYRLSDYILDNLLLRMDFKKKGSFRAFYYNLVHIPYCKNKDDKKIQEERIGQRQKVINWIKESNNKDFVCEALSGAYWHENEENIRRDIEDFLDEQEKENGMGELKLRIYPESFNFEKFKEYRQKKTPTQEKKVDPAPKRKIDPAEYDRLKRKVRNEGIKQIVRDTYEEGEKRQPPDKEPLKALARQIMDGWTSGYIPMEDAEIFQREIAKYDYFISRIIDLHALTPCSAEIILAETNGSAEQIKEFNSQQKQIADARNIIKNE